MFKRTLIINKREIREELIHFFNTRNRDVYFSMFGFQKGMIIVSYVRKKKKNALLLSTINNDNEIDLATGELKKPEIIIFYNMTKGTVDVVDEMAATYSTA